MTALGFLLQQGISSLPVNPLEIAAHNGWKVYRYSEFAARIKKDVQYLMKRFDEAGFAFWSDYERSFVICYNERTTEAEGRWTLTHEIGHIHLRHLSDETPLLARNGNDMTNPLYELEAECFAGRVLCPPVVLQECEASSPEEVVELCGVPHERAEGVLPYIADAKRTSPLEVAIEKRFYPFADDYKKNDTC